MAKNWYQWFEQHRHLLTGNGNWLQGGEPNCMPPDQAENAALKVLIARLSSYHDVARGITSAFLFQLAAAVDGCYVDMAFFPGDQDEKMLQKHQVPLWLGTSSKLSPVAFDIIAITNSVLQELVNLPAALHYSGIPLTAEGRAAENSPLLIVGGSNSYNLSILFGESGNGLVDGVLVGDGEMAFAEIIELVKKMGKMPRSLVLKALREQVPGFYAPQSYRQHFDEQGNLLRIQALDGAPMPVKARKDSFAGPVFTGGPILYDEEAAGASHLLMTAGCPSFCSFCKESWEQKPYREKELPKLLAAAKQLKASMGLSELALMSFNATTYTGIFSLVQQLNRLFDRVSIKSQRFDTIVNAPELLELQFDAGKRTYTCAMEGVSERIRTLLQKNLREEQILQGLEQLIRLNMRQLKVFLIVTGYENDADLSDFQHFLDRVKALGNNGKVNITFSFACLFRPPHTPLQFAEPRGSLEDLERLTGRLVDLVKKNGFDARISAGAADAFFSEFIAYADRRYTPILVEASIGRGFRYRGEVHAALYRFFVEEAARLSLPMPHLQSRDDFTPLPWDDIDTGVNRRFLFENFRQLQAGSENQACIRAPWGTGTCQGCGACPDAAEIARVTGSGPVTGAPFQLSSAARPVKSLIEFIVPRKWGRCGPAFIKAALARRLMLDNSGLIESFKRVSGLLPEFYACGHAIAEVEFFSAPEAIIAGNVNPEEDILVLGRAKKMAWPDGFWPVELESHAGMASADFSRRIDALLSKYRLKHLKQRRSGELHWEINRGQARKCGIGKISLDEEKGYFKLVLVKMPELHLLNQIAGSALLECRAQTRNS
jgi:radical SAM superfamily enzyme YgiQ (UPF0313 family)